MAAFRLDPRLEAASVAVGALVLCDVRLMDRRAWPWLVLVPRRAGVVEVHDLAAADRARLVEDIALVARVLKRTEHADKINVGALGNLVAQLHVHVVARRVGDTGWPGPVWGVVAPEPWPAGTRTAKIAALAAALGGDA
ncbi:MAG: HIT domain-containing protein [Alphaproteobacteria bacterium]